MCFDAPDALILLGVTQCLVLFRVGTKRLQFKSLQLTVELVLVGEIPISNQSSLCFPSKLSWRYGSVFTSRQQGMGLLRVSLFILVCLMLVSSVEAGASGRNKNRRNGQQNGQPPTPARPAQNPSQNGNGSVNPGPTSDPNEIPEGSSEKPSEGPLRGGSNGSGSGPGGLPAGFHIPIIAPKGPAPSNGTSTPPGPRPIAPTLINSSSSVHGTVGPLPAAAPAASTKVRADIPNILLERRRSPMRGISLPGPLKAFVVSMLQVSFIPRTFPREFAASWVKEERRPNASERAVQVALLQDLLQAILQIYDHPSQYDGPPIKDFSEFLSIVAPTEGDPYNSVKDEFQWMLGLLRQKDGLDKARRVNLAEKDPVKRADQFENPDVRILAQEREHLQHVYLKATLRSLLAAGTGVSPASYVIEVLIGSFIEALIQNPTNLTADIADTAAEALDGQPIISAAPGFESEQVSKNPVARALRQVAKLIRSASDYPSAEAAFLDFIRTLSELKGDSLGNVIVAFEKALEKVVQVFEAEAQRLVSSNELFGSDRQKERQTAILKLLMERYPLLLPQDVLKNIILDLLVMPVRPDVEGIESNEMMDVVLSHSGPILTNLLQRSGHLARSGGFLRAVTERLQSTNRPIPLPSLRATLQSDPNKYFDGNIPFETIPDTLTNEQLAEMPKADCVDPRVRGAGKFYLNYVVIVDGKRRRIKVQRPDVRYRLDVDHQIFRFLAPEIGQHFLPRSHAADRGMMAQRMQKQIDIRYHALMMELEAEQTARFQRDAYSRFNGRSLKVQTEEGPAEFVFQVPYVEEAVPGSLLLLMDEVRDIVDVKDFVSRYRGIASHAAESLYDEVFQQLVWLPLQQQRELDLAVAANPDAEKPKIYGLANRDSHAGNILVNVEALPHDGGFRVSLNLIDWGLTSTVSAADLKELLALGFGAGINDGKVVGEMLWSLSNMGRTATSNTPRSRDKIRELSQLKTRLMDHVYSKVSQLKRNSQYWGPAEWIYNAWIHGLAEFPAHLAGLHDVIGALDDTMITFHGLDPSLESGNYQGEERVADPKHELQLNVITRMEEQGTWPAIQAASERFGKMTVYRKALSSLIGVRAKSCAEAIAINVMGITPARTYVDPND
jgi:hypothetical protein